MSQPIHTSSATTEPETRSRTIARPAYAAIDEVAVVIDAGAHFEGVLTCPRATRIDGEFKGELTALGRIELGPESRVEARIEARDIVVAGRFEGELHASHSVELRATARVTGDISARELSAEEGCVVTGRCQTRTGD